MTTLRLEPLTVDAFAPFGDVIDTEGRDWFPINSGTTRRYHKLGAVDRDRDEGQTGFSIFRGNGFHFPLAIAMLERHPLGSQSFIPLNQVPFVAVVAPNGADDRPDEAKLRAFWVAGDRGVNYRRGIWHHPLLAIDRTGDYLVVDLIGGGPNCDEVPLSRAYQVKGPGLLYRLP